MSLVLDWQRKLGFKRDPFSVGILKPVRDLVVGLDQVRDDINLFILKTGGCGTIAAEEGMGKTTILRWLEEVVPHAFYHDAKASRDLAGAFSKDLSFFARRKAGKLHDDALTGLLVKKLKGRILLVDDAGSMTHGSEQLIHSLVQEGITVILADTHQRLEKLDLPADRLKVRITEYGPGELRDLIARRISAAGGKGTFPFDTKEIDTLVKRAKGNPRELLIEARERAVELSLKATPPKEPVEERRGRFFTIQIERGPKDGNGMPVIIETPKAEGLHEQEPVKKHVPAPQLDEAALLGEIVAQPAPTAHAPAAPPDQENMDAIMRKLSKELSAAAPPATKSAAKKGAAKKGAAKKAAKEPKRRR